MHRAVIFDIDGVLIDSYQAHLASWQQMGQQYGLEVSEQMFAETFGQTSAQVIRTWFGTDIADDQALEMDERKEELYRQIVAPDPPIMEGAAELIAELHKSDFALAVGSSGPPENVAVVVEGMGIGGLLAAQVSCADVTHGKPDPQVFLIASERLGVDPSGCAVIEDAPAGIEAANLAGMVSIAITGTASRVQLSGARMVVDSLRDLNASVIESVLG